jgi:hypothetical protein
MITMLGKKKKSAMFTKAKKVDKKIVKMLVGTKKK